MRHALDNLRYQLIGEQVSLTPLRVLACRAIEWQGWRATFYVLGASHAVTLEKNGVCVTELLTCAPSTAPCASTFAECGAARAIRLCPELPGLRCRVALTPFALTESDALLLPAAPDAILHAAYPAPLPHSPDVPVTRIGWRAEGRALRVETVHTYPEEGRGIRSETRFELFPPQENAP